MSAIRFAISSVSLLLVLSPAAQAGPIMEWLCGCSPNMTSQSTYTPAYVPTAVVAAPAPSCSSCAPQTTYYAPQTAYYAPTVTYYAAPVTTYRPFIPIVPRPTTTYYAAPGYNPYSAAPVTAYRPLVPVQPVVTTTRLIPYTSYRMVYPTTVAYYGVAPVYSVAPPCVTVPPPCADYGGAPLENYGAPSLGSGADREAIEAPSLPSGEPTTTYYHSMPSPSTVIVEKPAENSSGANRQVDKPAATQDPKPAEEPKSSGPDIKSPNPSNPASFKDRPEGNDSRDRTAMRPVRQVSRQVPAAVQPSIRVLGEDLWRPVKD
ncbi:MAG: hypothetical protein IT426_01015 [Pirellulales bacterium]|nr:hypothetical protein [Pirellulales bacterium]